MTKKLRTDDVISELEGSAFFPPKPPKREAAVPISIQPEKPEPIQMDVGEPVDKSGGQPVGQSVGRLTDQSTHQETNGLVDRPKAFYITRRLDRQLDEAVRYLQEHHGIRRVDRSTIVNAILDNQALWSEKSLDLLVDRVISQLTSRLVK